MKTITKNIVNLNRVNSRPRRVLNEPSAEPNNPDPCPFTCTSMMAITNSETTIWRMFTTVLDNYRSVFSDVRILFYRKTRRMLTNAGFSIHTHHRGG